MCKRMTKPIIPGFEIIKKLGQGGMAIVWLARQLSLDRMVAIKVLLPRFAMAPEEVARFRTEAQAAARLKHPGIVQVYDASVSDNSYYFVMEYIDGYTVGEWVRRKGTLSEHDALLVAEHVCEALGYAWDRAQIIHCDIKPDNVLIDADGTVKVTDLGLARTLNAMSTDVIEEEYVLGTPSYMSPEQARGDAYLDFRADIYSLGAMLYHLVTGQRMFAEQGNDAALELQITGTVPDPMDVVPTGSKPLCWLIERLLAKDPDKRGESWSSVQADIRRVAHGLPPYNVLHAEDTSTVERSPQRTAINEDHLKRLQVAEKPRLSSMIRTTLVAAVVAIAAAAAIKTYMNHATPQPPPAASPAQPSREPARPNVAPTPADYAKAKEMEQKLLDLKRSGNYEEAEKQIAEFSSNLPDTQERKARWRKELKWHRDHIGSRIRPEHRPNN